MIKPVAVWCLGLIGAVVACREEAPHKGPHKGSGTRSDARNQREAAVALSGVSVDERHGLERPICFHLRRAFGELLEIANNCTAAEDCVYFDGSYPVNRAFDAEQLRAIGRVRHVQTCLYNTFDIVPSALGCVSGRCVRAAPHGNGR